jgi:hypothetical protein
MKKRWTLKDLEQRSDTACLQGILSERLSELNPYAPLARRLQAIYGRIERGATLTGGKQKGGLT